MENEPSERLTHRLLWFVGLWVASVLALSVIALGIRMMILP